MAKKITKDVVNVEERLKALTGAGSAEQALAIADRVFEVAAQQNHFLTHMGLISMVIGPSGLASYITSPGLLSNLEGVEIVEQALLDFQKRLIEQRRSLMAAAKEEPNGSTDSPDVVQG